MELRQLTHFLAVARHGNIGRAADELNLTQPALSKSIRRLEQDLGVRLVDRLPRGVALTVFGEALATHAQLVSVEVGHTLSTIAGLRGARRGRVRVGAAPASFTHLLPQAISALLARHPDVRVSVTGGLIDTLLAELRKGALDFVVSALPSIEPEPALAHEKLMGDQVRIAARAGHPLARSRRLDLGQLVGARWVLPHKEVLTRQQIDGYFSERQLPLPEVVIETNAVLHIMSILETTDMLSFMPQQLIDFTRGRDGLVALPVPEAVWHRTVGLSYRRSGFFPPASEALVSELRQASQRLALTYRTDAAEGSPADPPASLFTEPA
jgi:DNA-binding transcriptional LysR family regulator